MNLKLAAICCAMCFQASTALAEAEHEEERKSRHQNDINWSHLKATSLEYDMDIQGVDAEPDGYELELSLELGDSFYGILERSRADGKLAGIEHSFDTSGYGFGFHGNRWFASYTYNTWEFDRGEFDVDTVRVGFRRNWTDRLEFNASYSWNNIEDADNDDGFQLGLAYELWEELVLTFDYETIGGDLDIDYYAVGVRFGF